MPKAGKLRKRSKASEPHTEPVGLGLLPEEVLQENVCLEGVLKDAGILNAESLLKSFPDQSDSYLRTLARRVNALGGWLSVTGQSLWGGIEALEGRSARTDYETVWFPVLKWHDFERKYRSTRPYSLRQNYRCAVAPADHRPAERSVSL